MELTVGPGHTINIARNVGPTKLQRVPNPATTLSFYLGEVVSGFLPVSNSINYFSFFLLDWAFSFCSRRSDNGERCTELRIS